MFWRKTINVVTHDGTFHLDDVFSIALIKKIYGNKINIKVVRTRNLNQIRRADWVVDVGKIYDHTAKRYDHHQIDSPTRENGIPYATIGLLWKHYGDELCEGNVDVAEKIDREFIQMIDAPDNGVEAFQSLIDGGKVPSLSMLTYLWMPNAGEKVKVKNQFDQLVIIAEKILERLIKHYLASERDQAIVKRLYFESQDKSIIELPYNIFIADSKDYPELKFTIYQTKTGNWKAKCLSDNFKCKVSFPESWRGIATDKLKAITNIDDAEFVHNAGFLAVAGSKKSILKMCKLAIELSL